MVMSAVKWSGCCCFFKRIAYCSVKVFELLSVLVMLAICHDSKVFLSMVVVSVNYNYVHCQRSCNSVLMSAGMVRDI